MTPRPRPPISRSKSQSSSRVIFDNTQQFIGLLDARGVALEVDQTTLAAAGVAREQVVGKPICDTPWFARKLRPQLEAAVARAAQGAFVRSELEILHR